MGGRSASDGLLSFNNLASSAQHKPETQRGTHVRGVVRCAVSSPTPRRHVSEIRAVCADLRPPLWVRANAACHWKCRIDPLQLRRGDRTSPLHPKAAPIRDLPPYGDFSRAIPSASATTVPLGHFSEKPTIQPCACMLRRTVEGKKLSNGRMSRNRQP